MIWFIAALASLALFIIGAPGFLFLFGIGFWVMGVLSIREVKP